MSERPELTIETDASAFRNFYYLKEELVQFCRDNGLSFIGERIFLVIDKMKY